MKKVFLFFLLLIFGLGLGNQTYANTLTGLYPRYLNGDRNFPMVGGRMGTGWYLDKSSIYVKRYAPPIYIINVNVCPVNDADRGNVAIGEYRTCSFLYNWDERKMYINDKKQGVRYWRYLDPERFSIYELYAGETAFYLEYRLKFYGSLTYYSSYRDDYVPYMEDDFYEDL